MATGTDKLNTAVIGLGPSGRMLAETAQQTGYYNIIAVADPDTQLAGQLGQRYGCAAFDDYRQLIVQNQVDVLLVGAATYSCAEHVHAAIKKGFHILKLAPLARNFEEASQLVQAAGEQNVTFGVVNLPRFSPAVSRLQQALQQAPAEDFYLITARCCYPAAQEGWRSDPKLAGGGVLLHGCYELIDLLVSSFSVCQRVYFIASNQASDKKQRQYLTEDTALLTMEFGERLAANIVASTAFGPAGELLRIYGKDTVLTLTDGRLTIGSPQGHSKKTFRSRTSRDMLMQRLLNNFAQSLLNPGQTPLTGTAQDNLAVMAVIEAAYLSARTGMPEQPGRILRMAR